MKFTFLKNNWVYIVFGIAVLFFVYKKFIYRPPRVQVRVVTFQSPLGWGYNITVNDSVFIHQDFVPAIQGKKGFATQSDAAKTGNLVLNKLKSKQPPSISLRELDSLHIGK